MLPTMKGLVALILSSIPIIASLPLSNANTQSITSCCVLFNPEPGCVWPVHERIDDADDLVVMGHEHELSERVENLHLDPRDEAGPVLPPHGPFVPCPFGEDCRKGLEDLKELIWPKGYCPPGEVCTGSLENREALIYPPPRCPPGKKCPPEKREERVHPCPLEGDCDGPSIDPVSVSVPCHGEDCSHKPVPVPCHGCPRELVPVHE